MSKDSIAITGQSAAAARTMAADRAQSAKPAGEMFGNKVAQAGHNNTPAAGKFKARVEHFFITTLPKALTAAKEAVLSLLRPATGSQAQAPAAATHDGAAKVRFAEQTPVAEPMIARQEERAKAGTYTAVVAQVETGEIEEARVGIYGMPEDVQEEKQARTTTYATTVARVETSEIEEARVGIYGVSDDAHEDDDARPEGPGKAYATVVARVETGVIEEARVGIYGVSEAGEAEGEISRTREGVYKSPFA